MIIRLLVFVVKFCNKYILFMTPIWQFSRKKIVYISTRDIKREKTKTVKLTTTNTINTF